MANFDVAFEWLMDSEDPKRTFEIVPDAPVGAHAIAGINSYSFPTAFHRIAALPISARRVEVYNFYLIYFWNTGEFNQLTSDEIAKRVFDAAVNMGSHIAVKLLQGSFTPSLEQDGQWGPDTIAAANGPFPDDVVRLFQIHRVAHYLEIVKARPEDEKYLHGWLVRAQR